MPKATKDDTATEVDTAADTQVQEAEIISAPEPVQDEVVKSKARGKTVAPEPEIIPEPVSTPEPVEEPVFTPEPQVETVPSAAYIVEATVEAAGGLPDHLAHKISLDEYARLSNLNSFRKAYLASAAGTYDRPFEIWEQIRQSVIGG